MLSDTPAQPESLAGVVPLSSDCTTERAQHRHIMPSAVNLVRPYTPISRCQVNAVRSHGIMAELLAGRVAQTLTTCYMIAGVIVQQVLQLSGNDGCNCMGLRVAARHCIALRRIRAADAAAGD